MAENVKVSIVIPYHTFDGSGELLNRCLDSIRGQSFQDYEIVIKKTGKGMSHNLNEAIKEAKGDLIKVLFADDMLRDKHALKRLVEAHRGHWTVTGCVHTDSIRVFNEHYPTWNDEIIYGNNTIGSPSVLMMTNSKDLPKFDENTTWLTDCIYYNELYKKYGEPTIFNDINVVIGLHGGQLTNTLTTEEKELEEIYVKNKLT